MYLQKTLSLLIQIIQNYKNVFSKDTFGIKFSNFLKMSLENTFLESVFPEDTFHMTKTTLHLGIFLDLYYLRNFLIFLP